MRPKNQKKQNGGCKQLLDLKMGAQDRPLQFSITLLFLLLLRQILATIYCTLYLNIFLPSSVLHLHLGASGTERVGRNKIPAHIAQNQ